ncbi:hypothetical protein BDB01DRAFT_785849 [Pilobolus umbonatus]|nr:hypothetical protein BDB01DRAFT_785849 [Pilobolus umbonatus]
MMYIDINRSDSSVLYIDSKKKEIFIENISDAVRDWYCAVIFCLYSTMANLYWM